MPPPPILHRLRYYDDVRHRIRMQETNESNDEDRIFVRYGSKANVVGISLPWEDTIDEGSDNFMDRHRSNSEVELRHLALFLPLSPRTLIPSLVRLVVAAMLALHHFNAGAPVTAGLVQDCPIKFTLEVFDSKFSAREATRALVNDVLVRSRQPPNIVNPIPTAILGPLSSTALRPTATLTGVSDLPQMTYAAKSDIFDNKDEYPLLSRFMISNGNDAVMTTEYLRNIVGTTHVAVLFTDSIYGHDYHRAFRSAASKLESPKMNVATVSVPYRLIDDSDFRRLDSAMKVISETTYRHVVAMTSSKDKMAPMMRAAKRHGLVGPHMFWLFIKDYPDVPTFETEEEAQEIYPLLEGAAFISSPPETYLERQPQYSDLAADWSKVFRTPEDLEYLKSKLPKEVSNQMSEYTLEPTANSGVVRMYDSTLTLALAACQAAKINPPEQSGQLHEFTGHDFHRALTHNLTFEGTGGTINFEPETGNIAVGAIPFVAGNLRSYMDEEGQLRMNAHITSSLEYRVGADGSHKYVWEKVSDFLYADGSPKAPSSLPSLNVRHVPLVARFFGMGLSGLVIALSIVFAIWTFVRRKCDVVRASQPGFLRVMCMGTLLAGVSGVLDSMQDPVRMEVLNVSCMLSVWLFGVGYVVTFAALFSKFRRVNKVFCADGQVRWTIGENLDIVIPCLLLAFLLLLVLSLWTAQSPVTYQLELIETGVDEYGRPSDANGVCRDGRQEYWLSFAFLYFVATLLTLREAYFARKITVHYSESHHVFIAEALILQNWLISIPIKLMGPPYWDYVKLINVPLGAFVMLFAIFAPKISKVHKQDREEAVDALYVEVIRNKSDSPTFQRCSRADDSARTPAGQASHELEDVSVTKERLLHTMERLSYDARSWVSIVALENGAPGIGNTGVNLRTCSSRLLQEEGSASPCHLPC